MNGPQGRTLREENSRTALTALAGPTDETDSNSSSSSAGDATSRTPQYFAALLATLSAFSAGTILGWSSPALPKLSGADSVMGLDEEQGSWLGSLVTLGAMLGAAPAGVLSQWIGRRRFLASLALPLLVGWLLVALGGTFEALAAGRFLGGLATGAVSVAAPVYCAEISEQRCRGALGTLFQLQLVVGILFAYVVGAIAPPHCFGLTCAIVPIVFFLTFVWMPETPHFLLSRNRRFAAECSLQWLRGRNADVQKELLSVQSAIQQAEATSVTWRQSLQTMACDRATRQAMLVSLGLMGFQQLSGINAVVFYSGSIFKSSGGSLSPDAASIVVATVMVVATLCATMLVDRAGRRPLLLLSGGVMGLCLAALAASYTVATPPWLPVTSVAVYIVVFSLGFGPIPWMMMGELFSPTAKSTASALAACCNWALAFLVTKCFPTLVNAVGSSGAFAFFATVCLLAVVFVAALLPETKGKSLEAIQEQLAGRRNKTPSHV